MNKREKENIINFIVSKVETSYQMEVENLLKEIIKVDKE